MRIYLAFFHLPCLAFCEASLILHAKILHGMIPELLSERVDDLAGRIHVEVNRTIHDELSKLSPFW